MLADCLAAEGRVTDFEFACLRSIAENLRVGHALSVEQEEFLRALWARLKEAP